MEKDEETAENRVRNIVDLLDSMDPGFVPADRPVAERLLSLYTSPSPRD